MGALVTSQLAVVPPALAHDDPDCPGGNFDCGGHNMMLVGERAAYVSHLPMFGNEHRFQVIAEVQFDDAAEVLDPIYLGDRAAHPEVRMYTVSPQDNFVLSRLFSEGDEPHRGFFKGTVFQGHLERGGRPMEGLNGISVRVKDIIYASELPAGADDEPGLRYVLFGSEDDVYLAHVITAAPDFDQIVGISLGGGAGLATGAIVTVPGRTNSAATRLMLGEALPVEIRTPEADAPISAEIEVGTEYYFEEGELLERATFSPTELEVEAGF